MHSYNGILIGRKKEWNIDTCYYMGETLKTVCYVKDARYKMAHIIDFIYIKCPEQATE